MRKLVNLIKKSSTRAKAIVSAALITAIAGGVAFAGYTPANRPTYDYNKGSQASNCANPQDPGYDHGICGSLTGPVFNSFINTPQYGDERAFFDASLNGATNTFKDVLSGVTSGTTNNTREVVLRTYIHNNANSATNASGLGVAHDTKVKITLPTGTDKMLRARSYINAKDKDGKATLEVTDTTELVDTKAFSISYVPGSAKMINAATGANGVAISDTVVGDGALVGGGATPDGNFPGCFEYKTVVEIRVRVNVADYAFKKSVRLAGDVDFKDSITAKPGDRVQYLLRMDNTGKATLDNVKFRDVLPPHMTLNTGSVKYYDPAQNGAQQQDKPLFDGGIIAPSSIGTGAYSYIRFSTTLKDDFEGCEVTVRNLAYNNNNQFPAEKEGHADVVIKKENCNPPAKAVTCDVLTAPKLNLMVGESTTFTASGTPTNTTITGYIFKVNGQTVQDSASNTYVFTQNATGTYNVEVSVKSPIGTVTSASCAKTVHVQQEVTPIYSCDAFTLSKNKVALNEKYTATVRYSASNGATFKQATFNFGDSTTYTTNTTANNTVSAEHSYAAKGDYGLTVKLEFLVNGETKVVEGGNCVNKITVTTTEKCPIPGKEQYEKNDTVHCNDVKGVTTLPDTGAGSMIGLFAAVTAAGAFLHTMWIRRAMNR